MTTGAAFAAPTAERLAAEHPEWRGWLGLLDVVAAAARDRVWRDAMPDRIDGRAPALAGATLRVERDAVQRLIEALFTASGVAGLQRAATRTNALELLSASIDLDAARFSSLAEAAGAPASAFAAVAPLVAVPWLQACGERRRNAAAAADTAWCPVCGAWAALAEARGLERERRLRCTRCGADWRTSWLACPFCENDDHTQLASLVAPEVGDVRKVDACNVCRGYVKTVTTLAAADAGSVRLLDLATVDLDVAAVERGYGRPPGLGHVLDVSVVERRGGRRFWR
ncbi:MAG TPA: formate dehydrogenase accessory protein FdhE [Methylomirabilota bacterium]|nr:formate dehydrogenase accessory protein FdhE [Methylomirabilota bacterium]